jgi:tetratricopeptide (TPR) repeat protein
LAVVTLAVFWPVTHYEFVNYDDTDFITANPTVQAGVTARGLQYALRAEVARNWHPVTIVSHMLDCQFFRLNAGRHHLTSLLLHAANSLLLFYLLQRMTGALWRSALVAALFAWHPLHVESVAWIAERKDVLSTLFWWLAILAYVGYVSALKVAGPRPRLFYGLALVLFALALMSKPMVVTLPFVLLLLDFWPLERLQFRPRRTPALKEAATKSKARATPPAVNPASNAVSPWRLILEKVPFFALSAMVCAITFAVQKHGGAMLDATNRPLSSRIDNALISYVRYPAKMIWPENLAALYLRNAGWPAWQVAGAAVLLLAVTAWVVAQGRTRPWLAFGWFWYLGVLVPVIGLVQVGMQTMADRYTYVPLVGLFLILIWGAADLAVILRAPRFLAGVAAALALTMCLLLTARQITWWKDSETLFKRMIDVTDDNYIARYNLGNFYSRQKQFDLAISNYQAALAAQPAYADAHNNLAGLFLDQKRYDEAIPHYREALRLKPQFVSYFNLANALADTASARHDTNLFAQAVGAYQQALQLEPDSSEAHDNFGLTWQAQNQDSEAIAEFQAAVRINPKFELAHFNLANALSRVGRLDEAIAHYETAARLNPARAESFNGAGVCYALRGKMEAAARQFERVIQLNPGDAGAYGNLGNALGALNQMDRAIPCYLKALQLNPGDFQTEFNLGLSLLRQNRRDEARTHFQTALRLHPNYPEAQRALLEMDPPAGR